MIYSVKLNSRSLLKRINNHKQYNKRCFHTKAKDKEEHEYEHYQVFQHKDVTYNQNINIEDVDDHLQAVYRLKREDKEDYFMSNGLDYDRCYKYINVVKFLNRCWQKTPYNNTKNIMYNNDDSKNKANRIVLSSWSIFSIVAFIYYFVKDDI